jgi:hypothetical protein
MNRRVLIHVTSCALLIGLVGAWSNAADHTPPPGGQLVQANDSGARRTRDPTKARELTAARHTADPVSLHGRSPPRVGAAARGISVAALPSNAIRSSGVVGAVSRSAVSFKPLAGNGVIGGPHLAGHSAIGGPANSRTVIKSGVDGAAFHHRS